ncbi:hypothetical protein CTAYLR_001535 [Chrysophaeum taylorii]|uniref:GRF-type domain-containing protein n=1 Tax=Chrysophaeum taylorii TaxID=2483200 RepID=A0AAD7XP32_9STRA|nr:hypothetical protein CTAYLR_001535 [Chrysophaeum taylorii]
MWWWWWWPLVVHGLQPRSKPPPPARLPTYEELAPRRQQEGPVLCAEHSQAVVRKRVHKGENAGREYWGCGNEIPCEHFEWCDEVRVAGDQAQRGRQIEARRREEGERVRGTVSRIAYRGEGGFTVARLRNGSQLLLASDEAAAVGTGKAAGLSQKRRTKTTIGVRADACLATARVGDEVRLVGRWTTHPRYGRQFEAWEAETVENENESAKVDAFAAWLGSGVVPQVGAATAQKIVARLGSRAEELLARVAAAKASGARDDEADEALAEAFGWRSGGKAVVSTELAAAVAAKVAEHASSRAVVLHLMRGGVPLEAAFALERQHHQKAAAVFGADPHGALMAIKGWGFRRADAVALAATTMKPDAPARLRYGLVHALAETAAAGHCGRSIPELVALAAHDLGPLATRDYEPDPRVLRDALDACLGSRQLRLHADLCFTPWLDHAEATIARAVVSRLRQQKQRRAAANFLPSGSRPSDEQLEAVRRAAGSRLFVIAGGPGTGKTYAARAVVEAWRSENPSAVVALAAPTARGAAALGSAVGLRATTIHRLLEYSPRLGDFSRNANNPLEIDALVVDEVSMLDVVLAARLLAAVPPLAPVLLVGDPDQLPSIGPGAVLRDLLACQLEDRPLVPRAVLTTIFRVSGGSSVDGFDASDVAKDARSINQGKAPTRGRPFLELESGGGIPDGSVLLDVGKNAKDARLALVEAVRRLEAAGFDPVADVQVLAPMKRGDAGVDALNLALQDLLNPKKQGEEGPDQTMRVKDRVIQLANDYDVGVFNGDVGLVDDVMRNGSFVAAFNAGSRQARVMYGPSDVGHSVSLAYALTVHKAQGNEYPVVLMPVVSDHYSMLRKELLYTAVSRAKRLLILVGSPTLLARAASQDAARSQRRTTGLQHRIATNFASNHHHATTTTTTTTTKPPPLVPTTLDPMMTVPTSTNRTSAAPLPTR